ncbi:hypothetical protein BKA70DRAFT_503868 [Coprinopsis sp. MPI-PUGE-AT-0042]|nr:hypothetical protein BKA70DRAFT_503868 [Coprinopsis sp. MPI-PUGE-AT-0042]
MDRVCNRGDEAEVEERREVWNPTRACHDEPQWRGSMATPRRNQRRKSAHPDWRPPDPLLDRRRHPIHMHRHHPPPTTGGYEHYHNSFTRPIFPSCLSPRSLVAVNGCSVLTRAICASSSCRTVDRPHPRSCRFSSYRGRMHLDSHLEGCRILGHHEEMRVLHEER